MKLEKVQSALADSFGVGANLGGHLYHLALKERPREILVTGWRTANTLCYFAAAMQELGTGRVIALDDGLSPRDAANARKLIDSLELGSFVEWRRSDGGRAWLLQELAASVGEHHAFDLVFMENTRDLAVDGWTLSLAERWLRPDGLLLVHGIGWTYRGSRALKDSKLVQEMPELLKNTPAADTLVKQVAVAGGRFQRLGQEENCAILRKRQTTVGRWCKRLGLNAGGIIPAPKAKTASATPAAPPAAAAPSAPNRPLLRCPLCGCEVFEFDRHMRKGHPGRRNAKCPNCGSLERHRLIWLYFQRRTNLLEMPRKRLLHVAPEACLETLLREHPAIDYLSGDLESPWHPAMVIMDITDIKDFKEGDFDVVYCSHVLEHVPEDQKAINELYRVLAPGGWAIIQVPIVFQKTFEDPSITTEEDRERFYRHRLHVRAYGMDFKDRLEQAGFEVEVVPFYDQLDPEERRLYGLKPQEPVFHCRKPARA